MILEELTGSEAIFGFCGWLTTRKDRTVMSGKDDASAVVKKISKFIDANKLKAPRDHWEKKLIHPTESLALIRELLELQQAPPG